MTDTTAAQPLHNGCYTVQVEVQGITPLLQHRFAPAALSASGSQASRQVGAVDYSLEWLETMYVTADGWLYQPARHLEGALAGAGKLFRIKGRRGKTYHDAMKAYCYVSPDEVLHLYQGDPVPAPGPELLEAPTGHLEVSIMRVRVNRAAVARSRLQVNPGWTLRFRLAVHDEQLGLDVVQDILKEAGEGVGIGDYRPRYGRFAVTTFEVEAA